MVKILTNFNTKKMLVVLSSIVVIYLTFNKSQFKNKLMQDNFLYPYVKIDDYNKQYLKMIKKYHPDKPDGNEERFMQIEQFRKQYLNNSRLFNQTLYMLVKFSE